MLPKIKDLQSNIIEGESGTGIGLTLMDINIASSTMSYFLMAPAPMIGCNEWKYEGEKTKDCRDPEGHVGQGCSLSSNECSGAQCSLREYNTLSMNKV